MKKIEDGVEIEMTPEDVAEFEKEQGGFFVEFKIAAVSARQFRMQLRKAGILDQVKDWVAAQDGFVQDAFEYSGDFVRDEPMMATGFKAMGFADPQIDAFFTAASKL